MASDRTKTRLFLLAALVVVLAIVVITIWPAETADTTGSGMDRPRDPGVAAADPAVPPALGLERISAQRAEPANRRDLFRFGSAQPEPAEGPDGGAAPGGSARPAPGRPSEPEAEDETPAPVGPPPAPPIPLRYVGYAETPGSGKVAALSDGRFTYHGREGDVIEGRWRVVQIGVESLVIERVDGTGRQTLRLQ